MDLQQQPPTKGPGERPLPAHGRNRILAATLVVLWVAVVALPLLQQYRTERSRLEVRDEQVLTRATRDVRAVLDLIGHGVTVEDVVLQSGDALFTAGYSREGRRIAVNPDHDWEDDDLLLGMAHECVHALFHQLGVLPERLPSRNHLLVEETAAYVLGAHLAGEVMTQRGGDGQDFAERQIREYRADCDQDSPDSAKRRYLQEVQQRLRGRFDPEIWYQIAVHYGSGELVDGVNAVYRKHDDPWPAAHEIADTYKLYYKYRPAEIPEP